MKCYQAFLALLKDESIVTLAPLAGKIMRWDTCRSYCGFLTRPSFMSLKAPKPPVFQPFWRLWRPFGYNQSFVFGRRGRCGGSRMRRSHAPYGWPAMGIGSHGEAEKCFGGSTRRSRFPTSTPGFRAASELRCRLPAVLRRERPSVRSPAKANLDPGLASPVRVRQHKQRPDGMPRHRGSVLGTSKGKGRF